MLLAVFMLREIEFTAARTQDMEIADGTVALKIRLHKTATGGQTDLTRHSGTVETGLTAQSGHMPFLWTFGSPDGIPAQTLGARPSRNWLRPPARAPTC